MTKKLEELLNVADTKPKASKKETAIIEQQDTFRDIEEFDKIAGALPAVKGLGDMADKELNEVAEKAMEAYDDLMDLGMNSWAEVWYFFTRLFSFDLLND